MTFAVSVTDGLGMPYLITTNLPTWGAAKQFQHDAAASAYAAWESGDLFKCWKCGMIREDGTNPKPTVQIWQLIE